MAHRSTAHRPRTQACALALLACIASACRTTESKRPLMPDPPVVHRAAPARAWEVVTADELVGQVVYFTSEKAPERSVYMVRNRYGQDLGWVDHLGRAYRLLPHHRDPAWVGTGTVAQGVARILVTDGPCTLVETALEGAQGAPEPIPGS